MLLLIDGYNLLHSGRTLANLNSIELQWERDRLIDQLAFYRQVKPLEIVVVFDGWQEGWSAEKRERKKGIDIIFSKVGEKADEVIKRFIRERGAGVIVITSDREISRYADRFLAPVIPSEQFRERLAGGAMREDRFDEEEERGVKRKGPSRRLSKKEKRLRMALKKL